MSEVNERTTLIVTVAFSDEDDLPVIPESASYRIDDVGSGTAVRDSTAIAPLSSSVDIEWEPSDTSILDETHTRETRRMTVTWLYDSSTKQGSAEYLVDIINLRGVTTPSPA